MTKGEAAKKEVKDSGEAKGSKMEIGDDPPKDDEGRTSAVALPPLEAAAWRLEKSLDQQQQQQQNPHEDMYYYYSNPAKIVRRWLGTSSGAAAGATLVDIGVAVRHLWGTNDPTATHSSNTLALMPYLDILASNSGSSNNNDNVTTETLMDAEETPNKEDNSIRKVYLKAASMEVLFWLWSLKVRLLWRAGDIGNASDLCRQGVQFIAEAQPDSSVGSRSYSSLYPLLARLWRFWDLCHGPNQAEMARAQNLAILRRDVDTAATLLNCRLRNLLQHSLVEQAQKLLSNSTFPETASNNQWCRYLYYSGRIQALRLEYTSSYSNLSQSLRKAPTNTGLGFRIAVQRLLIVVQLLMGEIPDRQVFYHQKQQTSTAPGGILKKELLPYLEITQAVWRGDLAIFTKVVSQHKTRLQLDETYTLISRLAHQVVKAGLRKLQASYSRLSLQDVADRLGLANARQAEFVVAKAVRDGVLDATIYHREGYVQSHDLLNVYATKEPAEAFHRRIAYCLTTHNDAVRAMRYPPDAYKKQLEASRGHRRKRGDADKTDEEKAQELEDELEEDY